jgi:hypothetical protein
MLHVTLTFDPELLILFREFINKRDLSRALKFEVDG